MFRRTQHSISKFPLFKYNYILSLSIAIIGTYLVATPYRKNCSKLGNALRASHDAVTTLQSQGFNCQHGYVVNLPHAVSKKPFLLSYSYGFADVILFNVFEDVPSGFYIDVGAWDPVEASDTKLFYELGWSGVNIEPQLAEYQALLKDRPRDTNLCTAVGAKNEQLTLHEFHSVTTFNETIANTWPNHPTRKVDVVTLTKIWSDLGLEKKTIHFLKIDVESYEKQVLLGTDFTKIRPQVLVIEAKDPIDRKPCHEDWEYILFQNGYGFAMEHFLNRFYYDLNHPQILRRFQPFEMILDKYVVGLYSPRE